MLATIRVHDFQAIALLREFSKRAVSSDALESHASCDSIALRRSSGDLPQSHPRRRCILRLLGDRFIQRLNLDTFGNARTLRRRAVTVDTPECESPHIRHVGIRAGSTIIESIKNVAQQRKGAVKLVRLWKKFCKHHSLVG
jgi:hypothetical protein